VAIIDCEVQSDHPQYKHLSEGFAEFVAVEILKSGQLMLIDRDKRDNIIASVLRKAFWAAAPDRGVEDPAARHRHGGPAFQVDARRASSYMATMFCGGTSAWRLWIGANT
jgi:hypothetical protein